MVSDKERKRNIHEKRAVHFEKRLWVMVSQDQNVWGGEGCGINVDPSVAFLSSVINLSFSLTPESNG